MIKREIIENGLLVVTAVCLFSFIVSFTHAFQAERYNITAPVITAVANTPAALSVVKDLPKNADIIVMDLPVHLTTASTSLISTTTKVAVKKPVTAKELPIVITEKILKKQQPTTVTPKPKSVTKVIESPVIVVTPPVKTTAVSSARFATEVASHIEKQTNDYRIEKDLVSLKPDDVLQKIAESYSATMMENDFFSHSDKKGCDILCRLEFHNYKAMSWGENLAQMKFDKTPTAIEVATSFMTGWKNSNGHQRNLLSNSFTHQGIGVAVSRNAVYVTVNFSEPK